MPRGLDDRPPATVMIALKRAYDPISRSDGRRVIVERLWPRGLSKAKLHVERWLKEAGPCHARVFEDQLM